MSLGKVSIIIEAAMAQFESDMGRAARIAEKEMKRVQGQVKLMESDLKKVGGLIGGALVAAVGAAAVAIKRTVDEADALSQTASKIGVTTEALSRLEYAANLSDVSMESLAGAVKRLGQFQIEALKPQSEQAALLRSIGVEAKDAATGGLKQAETMLRELADVFQVMPDGANKTALAVKLFGRSGSDLIPLLNAGSAGLKDFAEQSDRVGFTLDTRTGKAANDFNDKLAELKLSLDGLWRQAMPGLLPKLDEFADLLNSPEIREGFSTLINGSVTAVGALVKLGTTFANVSKFLGEEAAARVHGPSAEDVVRVEQRVERLKATMTSLRDAEKTLGFSVLSASELIPSDLTKTREEVLRRLEGELGKEEFKLKLGIELNDESARKAAKLAEEAAKGIDVRVPAVDFLGGGGRSRSGGKSDAEKEGESLQRQYESLLAQQHERIALFGKETEEARVSYQNQIADLSQLDEATRSHVRALHDQALANAKWIDFQDESAEIERVWADGAREAADAAHDKSNAIDGVLQGLQEEIALLRMSADAQEIYINQLRAGADAASDSGQRVAGLTRELQEARRARALVEDLGDSVRNLFEGVLDYTKGGKEAFSDFVDDIRQMAIRLLADAALRALSEYLASLGNSTGSAASASSGTSGGGFWGTLASAVASYFGGARAGGGPTQRGMFYEVNERGPELYSSGGRTWLMAGARGGHVTPLSARGGEEKPIKVIAVFGEDQARQMVTETMKSPVGERVVVTHFQRNKKAIGG